MYFKVALMPLKEHRMYTVESIIEDTDKILGIIEKVLSSKSKQQTIIDDDGEHLIFRGLTEDEVELLESCSEPLGKDKAKIVISDYFKWFGEELDSKTLDQFAEATQNVGIFSLHRGLKMVSDNEKIEGTPMDTSLIKINQLARALNKVKRECGLHGELCKKCPKCKVDRSHCHNPLCTREFIIS